MHAERRRPRATASACSLALAAASALLLGSTGLLHALPSTSLDAVAVLGTIAGWVALAWAMAVGVVAAAGHVRLARSRALDRLDAALLVAAIAVLALVLLGLPIAGAGGGTA